MEKKETGERKREEEKKEEQRRGRICTERGPEVTRLMIAGLGDGERDIN